MDVKKIKELIKLVETSEITGLAIEDGSTKVEIKKELPGQPMFTAAPLTTNNIDSTPKKEAAPAPNSGDNQAGLLAIKSPMIGTFYASPSPDSPPFVKIGEHISVGQPVCIVEAMKTFNEIESELTGVVEKILVSNAQPVEFGQPLILVKEAS